MRQAALVGAFLSSIFAAGHWILVDIGDLRLSQPAHTVYILYCGKMSRPASPLSPESSGGAGRGPLRGRSADKEKVAP